MHRIPPWPQWTPKELRGIYALLFLLLCSLIILKGGIMSWSLGLDTFSAAELDSLRCVYFQKELLKWETKQERLKRLGMIDPMKMNANQAEVLNMPSRAWNSLKSYRKAGGAIYSEVQLQKLYGMDSAWLARHRHRFQFSQQSDSEEEGSFTRQKRKIQNLKPFNPNKVVYEDLVAMGLPDFQARSILRQREFSKGFKSKSDFSQLYGFDSTELEELKTYLLLPDKDPALGPWDINTVDSLRLEGLPGIGSWLAAEVPRFREALGGFHSVEQLKDIYGVDSAQFEKIKDYFFCADGAKLRFMQINSLGKQELMSHPYIDYKLAKNMVNFRERIRLFHSAEDLSKLRLVDEALFRKLAPYLKTDSIRLGNDDGYLSKESKE